MFSMVAFALELIALVLAVKLLVSIEIAAKPTLKFAKFVGYAVVALSMLALIGTAYCGIRYKSKVHYMMEQGMDHQNMKKMYKQKMGRK